MKGFRGTLAFALIVAAAIGAAYWVERSSKEAESVKSEAEKVLKFEVKDVTGIKIQRVADPLELRKSEGKWRVVSPLQDEADGAALEEFLSAILNEKARDLTKEKTDAPKWSEYFLDQPGAELSLSLANGQELKLSISRLAAFDGSYFLRRGDSLLLGTSVWARHAEKSLRELRSKQIYRESGSVIRLEYVTRGKDGRLALEKNKEGKWSVPSKPDLLLDQERVAQWIQDIESLRATDFEKDGNDLAGQKIWKLDRPETILRVKLEADGKPRDWQLLLGPEKDGQVRVSASGLGNIVRIASAEVSRLRPVLNELRDRKQPFQVDIERVSEVFLKTPEQELRLTKDGSAWKLATPVPGKTFVPDGMPKVFEAVQRLEVREYLGGRAGAGLKPPKHQLVMKGSDGATLLDLVWGDAYKADDKTHAAGAWLFAKSNLSSETLAVDASALGEIRSELVLAAPAGQPQ